MPKALTYFVSDVHLGLQVGDPAAREQAFVAFLQGIDPAQTETLYLLGDIWDFWYEYRDVVPKGYVKVLSALVSLMDAGVKVCFFQGNHDICAGSSTTAFSSSVSPRCTRGWPSAWATAGAAARAWAKTSPIPSRAPRSRCTASVRLSRSRCNTSSLGIIMRGWICHWCRLPVPTPLMRARPAWYSWETGLPPPTGWSMMPIPAN